MNKPLNQENELMLRFFLSILLILVPSGRILAQPAAESLTLEDCVRLALNAQSSVGVALQESEIASRGVSSARAAFLPQAQLNNAYTYNSPRLHNPDEFSFVALSGIHEYNTQLTVVQNLDISGRLRAELSRARADRDAAAATLKLNRRDLKRAVSAAFYRVLLARHLVESAKDALTEAKAFADRSQKLFEKGEASHADVYKASSQVAFQQQSLSALELDAEVANHELASFWTDAVSEELVLEDPLSLAPPSLESIPATEGENRQQPQYLQRPEFDLLDAEQRGFLADSRQAHALLLPQANIVFQYGVDSLHPRIADRGYAAFVTLDIPVFDWFKTQNQARQSRLKARQVQINRDIATRIYSKEYQDALSRLKSMIQQVSAAEEQVKLSRENLRVSRIRYEGGEGSALEVVDAQNQLAQANTNYYSTLAGCWNAKTDLEVATGQ
jgi:outer membrane protein TolC